MIKFNTLFSILCIGAFFKLCAQEKYTVKGLVKDDLEQVLPDATVILRAKQDSTLVAGGISDSEGKYSLERIPKGNYFLEVSFVGFKNENRNVIVTNSDIELNPIVLSAGATELEGIVIKAKKPTIVRKPDRTIVSIKNSIYDTGENGFDLLNIIPEVRTDALGNIDFRGEQGVVVYLDDKRIRLTSQQLRAYLKSIPSESIDSFEIKSVPGAEYDAEGTAAIINIVTKKEYRYGLSGTLTSHYEQHRYPGAGIGGILNYKTGKFNFSTNYNFTVFNFFNDTDRTRDYPSETPPFRFDQGENYREQYNDHAFEIGVDYEINDNQKTGVRYRLNYTDWKMRLSSKTDVLNQSAQIDSIFTTINREDEFLNDQSVNAFYEIKTDTLNSKLQIDYDYVKYKNPSDAFYRSEFLNPDLTTLRPQDSSFIRNPIAVDIHTIKADFVKNFKKNIVWKIGSKFSFIETDNENTFFTGQSPSTIVDTQRSNRFVYNEDIQAFYTNLSKEWKKWSINLGIRLENTKYRGTSITSGESFDRDRVDLFPSVFIQRSFNDNHTLNLSYGRRILRPSYEWLNPFEDYGDPYSITTGNPDLNPAFSNSVELSYLFKSKYYFNLGYKRTKDLIGQVYVQDNDLTLISTYQNLSDEDRYFISASIPFDITKWWEVNTYSNLYYKKVAINSGSNAGEYDQVSYLYWLSNSFSLPKDYALEINGYYQSQTLFNIYESEPQGSVGIALKKLFLNDKLSVSVNLNDIFATQRSRITANIQDVVQFSKSKFTSRSLNIGLSYNFSRGKKKTSGYNRDGGNESEKDRIE